MGRNLMETLLDEKEHDIHGSIYHRLQVDFAYNSNHMEGSRLTHDQTRYIFETKTIDTTNGSAKVDDIIETVNHFRCFDKILDTINEPLTADYLKELHKILKTSTMSSKSKYAVVGDFKKYENFVGNITTTKPEDVEKEIEALLSGYNKKENIGLYEILDFHVKFEKIHPFYDGNGRVGRLIMFKECLNYSIVPFYIKDEHKSSYYKGLEAWQTGGYKGNLVDFCLMMQDNMKELLDYLRIDYDKTIITVNDILKEGEEAEDGKEME